MKDFVFDPNSKRDDSDVPEMVPEGKSLFTIWKFWVTIPKNLPPGNPKKRSDFWWFLNVSYLHKDTDIILNRLDNGQDGYFGTIMKLQTYNNIDTTFAYRDFMQKLDSYFTTGIDKKNPSFGRWHSLEDNYPKYKGWDEIPAGPLGLPVKLNIIHKLVPLMTVKKQNGKDVLDKKGYKVYVQACDDDGKPLEVLKEHIQCTQPDDDLLKDPSTKWKAIQESGWPVLFDLDDSEKEYRGEYHKWEDRSSGKSNNAFADAKQPDNALSPDDIEF